MTCARFLNIAKEHVTLDYSLALKTSKAVQLVSKAYQSVQQWKQMEMEAVVGWLRFKDGSEKRAGIKSSR